jgi:hypothetical protein
MEFLSFPKLPNLAIALGATSPVPADGVGSLLWSTTLGEVLHWNGTVWGRPPGNAGAASPLPTIAVSSFSALPSTYGTLDKILAVAADTGVVYYWAGFGWTIYGSQAARVLDPTVFFQKFWNNRPQFCNGTVSTTQSDVFVARVLLLGARANLGNGYDIVKVYVNGPNDADEVEMDQLTSVTGFGTCVVDDNVDFLVECRPGPFVGPITAAILT